MTSFSTTKWHKPDDVITCDRCGKEMSFEKAIGMGEDVNKGVLVCSKCYFIWITKYYPQIEDALHDEQSEKWRKLFNEFLGNDKRIKVVVQFT